jgi:hypothetical protein
LQGYIKKAGGFQVEHPVLQPKKTEFMLKAMTTKLSVF